MFTQQLVHERSWQHYSQSPNGRNNPSAHPLMNAQTKCGPPTQWNIIRSWKQMRSWHMLQYRWALETWCLVREVSQLQKTCMMWFHLREKSRISKYTEAESRLWLTGSLGDGGMRVTSLMGWGLFEGDEMIWSQEVVMVGKHYKYIKCHSIVCFKWLTWWILCGDFCNQKEGKR